MVYPIMKRIFWPVVSLFIKRIEGLENLSDSPAIYVSNHNSYLDGPLVFMLVAWHRNVKVHGFALKDGFNGPIWSRLFEHYGAIRVGGSIPKAVEKYKQGGSLMIFPEGRRSDTDSVEPLKHTGVGVIALLTKAPIIPIGLDTYHFWGRRHGCLPRFNRTITLCIGKPMRFSAKPTKQNITLTINTVMKEVKTLAKHAHALTQRMEND